MAQRDPTEPEIIVAVVSLYRDQLRPYGRILRKRLIEEATARDMQPIDSGLGRLRQLCSECKTLRVEMEASADWSVTLEGVKADFVDIYGAEDDFSEECWAAAAQFFETLQEDELTCLGGRYMYAQKLHACNLDFLKGMSLGKVCHFVQISMAHRKLLGYCNGSIVPYCRSQTKVKVQCAEQRSLCRAARMPLATWDSLQFSLVKLLDDQRTSGQAGLPLSNVKRLLRARFKVDLSETALGHATLCDLLKDERLQDVCAVRLLENGYFVEAPGAAPACHLGEKGEAPGVVIPCVDDAASPTEQRPQRPHRVNKKRRDRQPQCPVEHSVDAASHAAAEDWIGLPEQFVDSMRMPWQSPLMLSLDGVTNCAWPEVNCMPLMFAPRDNPNQWAGGTFGTGDASDRPLPWLSTVPKSYPCMDAHRGWEWLASVDSPAQFFQPAEEPCVTGCKSDAGYKSDVVASTHILSPRTSIPRTPSSCSLLSSDEFNASTGESVASGPWETPKLCINASRRHRSPTERALGCGSPSRNREASVSVGSSRVRVRNTFIHIPDVVDSPSRRAVSVPKSSAMGSRA